MMMRAGVLAGLAAAAAAQGEQERDSSPHFPQPLWGSTAVGMALWATRGAGRGGGQWWWCVTVWVGWEVMGSAVEGEGRGKGRRYRENTQRLGLHTAAVSVLSLSSSFLAAVFFRGGRGG